MEWLWIRNKQQVLALAIIIGLGTVASAVQGGSSPAVGGGGRTVKCSPIVVPCTPHSRSPFKPPRELRGPPPWAGRWNHWRKVKVEAMAKAEAQAQAMARAKSKARTGASGKSGAMAKAQALTRVRVNVTRFLRFR